jgi:hypothetical protein
MAAVEGVVVWLQLADTRLPYTSNPDIAAAKL